MSTLQLTGSSNTAGVAGRAILGAFAGSPLVALVVFAAAFPDTNYTVVTEVVATSGRTFAASIQNRTPAGFEIHLSTSQAFGLSEVLWFATPF